MKDRKPLKTLTISLCAFASVCALVHDLHAADPVPNQHSMIIRGPAIIEGANSKQIALLRAFSVSEFGANFAVGNGPGGIAFDGENMWITINNDDIVTKR